MCQSLSSNGIECISSFHLLKLHLNCSIHVLYQGSLHIVVFLIGNYQYPFQNITTPASWPCNAIRMENSRCRFAYFPDTFSIIPTIPPHNLSTLPLGRVKVFIQEDCKYSLLSFRKNNGHVVMKYFYKCM